MSTSCEHRGSTALTETRRRRFPALDPARILYEDDAVIALDAPEGVPSQSADPTHPDDLVHRLKVFLRDRDGSEPYLGSHQRLDQDTSGVILYALDKRANKSLAAQFEGRAVDKRYVAVVEGWSGGGRRLEHQLVRGRDGNTVVAGPRDRRAKRAVTHVEVLERAGGRALLALRIETGRTHQIRAQLAASGAPILGDRLYGGARAPRLMLHAARLSLRHPLEDTPLAIDAPTPPSFLRALRGEEREPVSDALARAKERRWGLAHRADTTAFRLVNEGGDGLPGLAVDVYDDWAVVHVYRDDAPLEPLLDALDFRGVYLKQRPKQANVIVDGRDERYAPSEPVRGAPAPDPLVIHEHGVPYRVRLGEGLSTGIFLDQRDNRARVRELAAGRRVLNLFSYTCPFSIAAAAGGAASTLNVDASARLLEWGEEGLTLAGLAGSQHAFLQADCFEALEGMAARGERFDLICCDPPTYSRTKASRWTSGTDWVALAAACLRVLSPGGHLLACSNDRRMPHNKFRRYLHEGAREAGVSLAQLKDLPCSSDFPPPVGREPHLKSLLARLE